MIITAAAPTRDELKAIVAAYANAAVEDKETIEQLREVRAAKAAWKANNAK